MKVKTILDNEKYLRQVSKEVDFKDKFYINDIKKLENYCKNNNVFAMSAIQIGVPKRIIYMKNTTTDVNKNCDLNYNENKIMINPNIIEVKGHTRYLEACASCLDICAVIDRPYSVIVEYYNINGQIKKEKITG